MANKIFKSTAIDIVKSIITQKTDSFMDNIGNIDTEKSEYKGKIVFKKEDLPSYNAIEIANLFEMLHMLACTADIELTAEFFDGLQTYQLTTFYKAYVATPAHDNEFADTLLDALLTRK